MSGGASKEWRDAAEKHGASKQQVLHALMIRKGYPEDFVRVVCNEMRTDFTAQRMIGYIARAGLQPLEDVADEMLAILSDRKRIVDKHIADHAQGMMNRMYRDETFFED